MFSFQNKKVLLPGHDARKNLGHTSECGGRNTPFDRVSIGENYREDTYAEINPFDRVSIGERKSDITHTSRISKFYPTFRV